MPAFAASPLPQPGYFLFSFMFLYFFFLLCLWCSSTLALQGTPAPARPGRRKAQVGSCPGLPLLGFILLHSPPFCGLTAAVTSVLNSLEPAEVREFVFLSLVGGEGGLQSIGSAGEANTAILHVGLAERPGRAELVMDSCSLSCRMTQGIVRLTWMKMKMRRRRMIWKMTAWKSPQANPVSEPGSQSHWCKVIMTSDPSGAGGLLKQQFWRGQELIPCCLKSVCQCELRSW